MLSVNADNAISRAIEALQHLGDVQLLHSVSAHLNHSADDISAELKSTVLAEIPAYTLSRDPVTLRELTNDGPRHLAEIVRLLEGGTIGDFRFVRDHARLRAEHHFPLEALLHAYRCTHKVLMRWLHDAVSGASGLDGLEREVTAGLADFAIEYTDAISTVASIAYVDQVRLLAEIAGDERAQLLNILLGGYDESDARVASVLREAGYLDSRQSFCVVLSHSVDATEMANPARARRLADTLDQLVPHELARRLIDVRNGRVVCVFSAATRASGWTTKRSSLASRIASEMSLAGNAVLIGVSGDVSSTSTIPSAHRQALLALRMANRMRRVVQFAAMPLRQLMIHLAGEELQRLLPTWANDFQHADERLGGALSATLRAYADADMNVLKAAMRLEVHPNTIYARMNRIQEITGLNARVYFALTDLLTVADARVDSDST